MSSDPLTRAQELARSIPIGKRHAIVQPHNADVSALTAAAWIAATEQADPANTRLACEVLFAIGYIAGQGDARTIPDVFKED